jgi:hypothetical protein
VGPPDGFYDEGYKNRESAAAAVDQAIVRLAVISERNRRNQVKQTNKTKIKKTLITLAIVIGSTLAVRADTPQPVPTPVTQTDINTVEWLYLEVLDLQQASSNEQAQLSTIEKNPVLTLGQYMTYTPATSKTNALELISGVNIKITKGLLQAN